MLSVVIAIFAILFLNRDANVRCNAVQLMSFIGISALEKQNSNNNTDHTAKLCCFCDDKPTT